MKSILYLEDDTALAFVSRRALEKRGYNVVTCENIRSAQNFFSEHSVDYALLDLKIGNQTSLAFIGEIRARANIPIVVLTGYGTIRTAVQAMKLGAINFLSKPCTIEEIIAALTDSGNEVVETPSSTDPPSLKHLEWEAIQRALDENNGNITATARQLKMHRRTLQRKLQKRHVALNRN